MAGAYFNTIKRTVKYLCPADIVPPYIDVDISELDVGQKFVMQDLKVHPALCLLQSPDQPVCNIIGSRGASVSKKKWVFCYACLRNHHWQNKDCNFDARNQLSFFSTGLVTFSQIRNLLLLYEQFRIYICSSKVWLSWNCNMIVCKVVQGSVRMLLAENPSDCCIRFKYSCKILIIFDNII